MAQMTSAAGRGVPASKGEHEVRAALLLIVATFVTLILSGLWTLFVGTASFGGDESDLVRGAEGVLRNLPAYLVVAGVGSLSIWFGARSVRDDARHGVRALATSCVAVALILSQVTRDAAEVAMTTRAATVSWMLFGIDALVLAVVFVVLRRWALNARDRVKGSSPMS